MEPSDDAKSDSILWGGAPSTPRLSADRDAARDDLLSYLLSRRGALVGGGAALLTALIGSHLLHATPALASTPPSNAAAAAALATSYQGYTRAQLTPIFDDAPWSGYGVNNPWCAWFGSWFMRVAGVGYQTYASGLYAQGAPVTTPAVGDICYYPGDGHVGMVVEIAGSVARVVEGNAGDAPGIVKYRPNGPYTSNHQFSRPAWPSGSTINGERTMALLFNKNMEYVWALAGLGQAEAGWIETTDAALATKFGNAVGTPTVVLTLAQWADIKAKFEAQY